MTQLLQNAVYGSALILAVALLRRVLKDRLVPGARLALWAVCLFRLLTPAAPESVFSLWGLSRLFAPQSRPDAPAPYVPGYIPPAGAPAPAPQTGPAISWETVLFALWLAVGTLLAVRYVLIWNRTRRAVACAIPVERPDPRYAPLPRYARLREGPMEGAPLTFGAVRPTVVLSPGLEGETLDCVLAHEGVHAARRDNLWHYVMAAALAVHWWNPAVWLMSRLLRRDIELSCDRAALNKLGGDRRAEYAQALISLATQGSDPDFCQTFGRKAVEERIRTIMKFKKTSVIGVIFSLTLVLALTAAFASEPKQPDEDSTTESYESSRVWSMSSDSDNALTDFTINLDYLEKNLAQHVADGTMTQEEADRVLEKARQNAVDGELHWTFSPDSGLVNDHFDENGDYRPGFNVFYKDPDGELHPVDPATIVSGFIFNEDVNDPVPSDYVLVSGYDSVKYFPMTLDDFLDGLAQEVKAGNMTQAVADQRVADLLTMMKLDSLSDIKTDGDPLAVYASRYDYKVGGYSFGPDPKNFPEYIEEPEDLVEQGVLQGEGEGNIVYDDDTGSGFLDYKFYDYDVKLPTLDENGNWVAADGSIIGTKNPVPSPEPTSPVVIPDLNSEMIPAKATNGKEGYIRRSDTLEGQYGPVNSPEEAVKYMEWLAAQPSSFTIPVYDEAGNVIGEFPIVNSAPSSPYAVSSASVSGGPAYPVCTVAGCTLEGQHDHNGMTYCGGAGHQGDTCDGTCLYCAQQSAAGGYQYRHGSDHH